MDLYFRGDIKTPQAHPPAESTYDPDMGTRDTYQHTLLKACLVAGDESALAKKLGVPVSKAIDWLLGDEPMPTEIFLRAVDIVLASNKAQIEANRRLLEEIRRRHALRPGKRPPGAA